MGPWAFRKRAQHSYMNQAYDIQTPRDRGGEQGDAQGPLEVCADLAVQAREVRHAIHSKQHAGDIPWS
eukprot:11060154-Lingulodinium_polyedra.AAC.1